MERETRGPLALFPPWVVGVFASATAGAGVGLALWIVGVRLFADLPDVLLCGAIFGLVVGTIAVTFANLVLNAVSQPGSRVRMTVFALGSGLGFIPGALIGNRDSMDAIIYGTFGAIGAGLALVVQERAKSAAEARRWGTRVEVPKRW